jgi:hypothetical protein
MKKAPLATDRQRGFLFYRNERPLVLRAFLELALAGF